METRHSPNGESAPYSGNRKGGRDLVMGTTFLFIHGFYPPLTLAWSLRYFPKHGFQFSGGEGMKRFLSLMVAVVFALTCFGTVMAADPKAAPATTPAQAEKKAVDTKADAEKKATDVKADAEKKVTDVK